MRKENGNYLADKDCLFVLTSHGYDRTPDSVKHERAIGKPVPGFAGKVPCSWIEKGYVEERGEGVQNEEKLQRL